MKYFTLLMACVFALCLSSCVKEATQNPDKSVTLVYDTLRLVKGTNQQISSSNFSASEIKWGSTDTTVISVDATGLISAKTIGQATITAQSKNASVSATCPVIVSDKASSGNGATISANIASLHIKATDIAIATDGTAFIVGNEPLATGGYSVSKYINGTLTKLPDCGAVRIAVSPKGMPWVVDYANKVHRYNGTSWDVLPGAATDIGIGADGSVFAIGTETVSYTGGYNIMKWQDTTWTNMADCAGVRIAVDPKGTPWVVNKLNIVYQYSGSYLWLPIYGISATDIGIGADGSIFTSAQNVTSSTGANAGTALYKYLPDSGWAIVQDAHATSVAVSPQGNAWWTGPNQTVHVLLK